jgi:lipoprotein-releasing system permease protein
VDYRLQIARRYLFSRRRVTLISVITGISVTGVTLGVAALIVVLSVMNGFYDFVRDLLVAVDPHVRIVSTDARGLAEADSLMRLARTVPHVASASAYVEGKALLVHGEAGAGANQVVQVRGLDPQAMDRRAQPVVRLGVFEVTPPPGDPAAPPGVVVGFGLAQRLGLAAEGVPGDGSRVGLLSAPALERTLTHVFGAPPVQRFVVRGLYEQQAAAQQQARVFVALGEAQRLFRLGGRVSGVDLRLDDLERAGAVKAALAARLDPARFRVETWYDLQRSLYDVMRLEKWGASAILLLIVVVAAFNIVGSLTMVAIEKRRDVGVLQAMGVSRANVRRIFLLEGALIGVVGVGLGCALGLGLALAQDAFGLVKMAQAESFLIEAYPVAVQATDVLAIAGVAFALCVAAAVYPARRAAAIAPARAVHLER